MHDHVRVKKLLLERKACDWSFLPVVCWSRAVVRLFLFVVLRHFRRFRSNWSLLKAHRYLIHCSGPVTSMARRAIENVIGEEFSENGRGHAYPATGGHSSERDPRFVEETLKKRPVLKKTMCIVLKAPRFQGKRVVEKGALVVGGLFSCFRHCVNMDLLLQHYVLIIQTAWSAYADFGLLYFTRFADHHIIVTATEKRDFQFLEGLGSNLIPVPLGISNWVNPSVFRPLEGVEKRYDAVMVAWWWIFKRHHALFRVLRDLDDPSFKVALVGPPWPAERKEVELLVDAYGVGANVTLFGRLPHEEVNMVLNQSKVNILLSRQEGANRSLFEGFFAGVPGLALKNIVGIRKDYFNAQTGRLVDEKDLRKEL